MEEPAREKTPEEKARLKVERRDRKKAKRLDARATKRGITVEALKELDEARLAEEASQLSSAPNKKKRSREGDDQKVQRPLFPTPSFNSLPSLLTPS